MSLFGSQPQQPTFSFGTPAATPAAGGQASTSTPLFSFGTPQNTTAQQNKPPSLFGGFGQSTNTNTAPAANATPSFFGNTTQQQPQNAQQPSTFGGFGGLSQNTNNAQAGNTGFGGSSLFGASTSQPGPQQQQQQHQQQQPASNLFSSLGKPNPLTISQLLSSSSSQPAAGLGASQPGQQYGSSFGASTYHASQQQPPQPNIEERLMAIKNSWDPSSPQTRFSCFFYNLSPTPITVPLTSLPVPGNIAASPAQLQLYKSAILENPSPAALVPVLATSFDDLQKRVNAQKNMASLHLGKLRSADMAGKIKDGNKKHWSETIVRIERLNRTQVRLEGKLVHICTRLAGLQTNSISSSPKEEGDLLLHLQRLQAELGGSSTGRSNSSSSRAKIGASAGSGARLAGIVNELWMVVSQRKALMQSVSNGRKSSGSDGNGLGETFSADWGVVDDAELQKILEVLAQQQKSLDYLSKTLRSLLVDIDTSRLGFGLTPIVGSNTEENSRDRASIMS